MPAAAAAAARVILAGEEEEHPCYLVWGPGSVSKPGRRRFFFKAMWNVFRVGCRRRFFQGPMLAPGGEHSAFKVEGRHGFFSACGRTGVRHPSIFPYLRFAQRQI